MHALFVCMHVSTTRLTTQVLVDLTTKLHNNGMGLAVLEAKEKELNTYTLTKEEARMQSREERMNRRKMLLQLQKGSDNEEEDTKSASVGSSEAEQKLDQELQAASQEKVTLQDFELLKVRWSVECVCVFDMYMNWTIESDCLSA
jgi:hypothetical protein